MMTLPKDKYGCSEYLRNNPTWDIEDSYWKAKRIVDILATARCRPSSICDVGCGAGGILAELRRREHYEKPSIKRKRKKAAKKRGAAKATRLSRR